MYGTTMIGTLAKGVSQKDIEGELKAWEKERHVPGFMSSHVLVGDDGTTVVNVAVFDSKASYLALADDPEQDKWYQQRFRPMLSAEPQWIDGDWIS